MAEPELTGSSMSMDELRSMREAYRSRKSELQDKWSEGGHRTRGVAASLRALSDLTDATLKQLWRANGLGEPLALLAVGGFGRREL